MEITELLQRVHAGDQEALNTVIPLVYAELKKLASSRLRHEGKPVPLETTALVHEAFVRLAGARHPVYESRVHFYAVASRLMRQILVDLARTRQAEKRNPRQVNLADLGPQPHRTVVAIDLALQQLGATDPFKVQLIEMRYFGGMTAEESAHALGISVHVVRHELRLAQAWLRRELAR